MLHKIWRAPNWRTAMVATTIPIASVFLLQQTVVADEPSEPISIWVNNAPAELVVNQLAMLGGKQFSADADLQGQISGRFDGSIEATLRDIAETHPLLFDLSDTTLQVANTKQKSTATVALGDVDLDATTQSDLLSNVLGGNDIVIREAEVVVSGHPAFVKRTAMFVTAHLAKSGQERLPTQLSEQAPVPTPGQSDTPPLAELSAVDDGGAKALVEDLQQSPEQENDSALLAKPVRWVTDIPGFDTF